MDYVCSWPDTHPVNAQYYLLTTQNPDSVLLSPELRTKVISTPKSKLLFQQHSIQIYKCFYMHFKEVINLKFYAIFQTAVKERGEGQDLFSPRRLGYSRLVPCALSITI